MYPDTVAQKSGESLAVAISAFNNDGLEVDLDQEVFGIGVRHRYFSFWHTCMLVCSAQILSLL